MLTAATKDAAKLLIKTAKDPSASMALRIDCAKTILDRVYHNMRPQCVTL